jgi:hypothetical protein
MRAALSPPAMAVPCPLAVADVVVATSALIELGASASRGGVPRATSETSMVPALEPTFGAARAAVLAAESVAPCVLALSPPTDVSDAFAMDAVAEPPRALALDASADPSRAVVLDAVAGA